MIQRESKLLLNTPPTVIQPELACALGLNEAIVLQQVHCWLTSSCTENNIRDGRRWVYYPMETQREDRSSWKSHFPFLTVRTIRRVFTRLENKGILITGTYNADTRDRTKWYTIDYEKLADSLAAQSDSDFRGIPLTAGVLRPAEFLTRFHGTPGRTTNCKL